MANKVGELYWEVDANTSKFDKSVKTTETKAKTLGQKFTSLGKVITAGFVVAAVAGVAKVGTELARVTVALVNTASEAQETRNKFGVTFSEISEAANETADNLAESFGLSEQASKSLLANTGDLLSGFGYTQEAALDLSEQVNTLAGDLSSFANVDVKSASDAITKGLLGEREMMKSLGIAITEADIKQLAEEKGIVGELDRQAKAALTLEIALRQSKNAAGDFSRSMDSYANQARISEGAIADLRVEMGETFLPAATSFQKALGEAARGATELLVALKSLSAIKTDLTDGILDQEQSLKSLKLAYVALSAKILVMRGNVTAADLARKAQLEGLIEGYDIQDTFLQKEQGYQEAIARAEKERVDAETALANLNTEEALKAKEEADAAALKAAEEYTTFINDQYLSTEEGKVAQLQEEIALIREGILLYGDSAEAQLVLGEKQDELLEKFTKTGEALTDTDQVWEDWYKNGSARLEALSTIGITSLLSSFSDLGEAFVAGELGWDSFAQAGLNAIAAVLQALGAQLAAQAAALIGAAFFSGGGSLVGLGPVLAGSAAAYASSGVVSGLANSFESGGLMPGIPSSTDNMVANVGSGEEVVRADDPKNIANGGDESTKSGDVYLDAYKVGYVLAKNVYNVGGVLIDGKRALI